MKKRFIYIVTQNSFRVLCVMKFMFMVITEEEKKRLSLFLFISKRSQATLFQDTSEKSHLVISQ